MLPTTVIDVALNEALETIRSGGTDHAWVMEPSEGFFLFEAEARAAALRIVQRAAERGLRAELGTQRHGVVPCRTDGVQGFAPHVRVSTA